MPRRCCVTNCQSNYDSVKCFVSTFQFPKDDALKRKWISAIPRADFTPSASAVVCEKHFHEHEILRVDKFPTTEGEILEIPRKKPKLKDDAVPSVFSGCPKYLSRDCVKPRKNPDERRQEHISRENRKVEEFLNSDRIHNFSEFSLSVSEHAEGWHVLATEHKVVIYQLSIGDIPQVSVSIVVHTDMTLQLFVASKLISATQLSWLFDSPSCALQHWSQLENLLQRYCGVSKYDVHQRDGEECLKSAQACLKDAATVLSETKDESEQLDLINFIIEQIGLISVAPQRRKYSPRLIRFAFMIYVKSSSAYQALRMSNCVILPHAVTLKRLSTGINVKPGTPCHQKSYLCKISDSLSDREKCVSLIVDEMHLSPKITYKSGKVCGFAENEDQPQAATTVQSFMISSVMGNCVEMVALLPVKNANAEFLTTKWSEIVKFIQECGFQVVCTITDNNRINRRMFQSLMNLYPFSKSNFWDDFGLSNLNEKVTLVSNPQFEDKVIFLLFDSVHLLRTVRNNWFNQKNDKQTFVYPTIDSVCLSKISGSGAQVGSLSETQHFSNCFGLGNSQPQIQEASVSFLKQLYAQEQNNLVKSAPALCYKSLYPTSIERQNMDLVLKLFNEKTIAALHMHFKDNEKAIQTANFLQLFLNWWKIFNINHAKKGANLRDHLMLAFTTDNDIRFEFLEEFAGWLLKWEEERNSLLYGILSKETMSALIATTCTMIVLVKYLLKHHEPCFVLSAKIQSDHLEGRFGLYRGMSGSSYHVSVEQILESEKKIRIASLLELHSNNYGNTCIKSFFSDAKDESLEETEDPFPLYDVLSEPPIFINYNTKCILTYIAGYCASKVMQKTVCTTCRSILCLDKNLIVEIGADIPTEYQCLFDRGGLKYPSPKCLEMVMCGYSLFQHLISESYESLFLQHSNQKSLFFTLMKNKLNDYNETKCNQCGKTDVDLLLKAVPMLSNILLNNYTKLYNDYTSSQKAKSHVKRKLQTFSK